MYNDFVGDGFPVPQKFIMLLCYKHFAGRALLVRFLQFTIIDFYMLYSFNISLFLNKRLMHHIAARPTML